MKPETAGPTWLAPAKLNLFLRITGQRPDGYHQLQTLFQLLDWGDQLRFEITRDPAIRRQGDVAGVPVEADLSLRAARLLQAHCGIDRGARIGLLKQIPLGSGLGGASSDAATVLLVLNELWGCGLQATELATLGLSLGADVPLFVHGHSAWGEGVGEQLCPAHLGPRHYVLLFPRTGLSTAAVFADPELPRQSRPLDRDTLISGGDFHQAGNDCLAVARRLNPELDRLCNEVSEWGQWGMSGTGSTLFLPVSGKKAALRLTSKLKCRYNVRAVGGIDISPVVKKLGDTG